MGEVSEHYDREDAKKYVPLSYWVRGPAGWFMLLAALAALFKWLGADIPLLQSIDWMYIWVALVVLLCIWVITNLRVSAAVGGDVNTPID